MFGQELIDEIRKQGLVGRSGSCFATADKWQAVHDAQAERKYVVANGAEGEPDTSKDFYIMNNYAAELIKGVILAMQTVGALEGFIYMREAYHELLEDKYDKLLKGLPIKLITERPGGYRCGEESILLNVIEKQRSEPRNKPPFPTQKGLWGYPTLINNVETLYSVYLIEHGQYRHTRFFTIGGKARHPGVYEAPEKTSIKDLLTITDNEPKGKTFVQMGGGASGEIIPDDDYDRKITGLSAVTIYTEEDIPYLVKRWANFYRKESCGHCVPCREGSFRLWELTKQKEINWQELIDIIENMEKSSFCALGRSAALPYRSLIKHYILKTKKEGHVKV